MRSIILTALSLPLIAAACGDSFSVGAFPQMEVTIDSVSAASGDEVSFVQTLQSAQSKTVELVNNGEQPLTIDGIDWKTDESGQPIKNDYMEIDWRGAIGPNSFPFTVDVGTFSGLTLGVRYEPPLGMPLDDFSDSVLVVSSDARDSDGDPIGDFEIVFGIRSDAAFPRVTPTNYTFTNATEARPERQDFTVYNDADLATASFQVLGVSLEDASDEFVILGAPSDGTEVLAPGDPGYQDVVFTVEYRPQDSTPDTNAILIETDAVTGGTLRVPLSTATQVGSYALSFSDTEREFDFTNTSQNETRSVIVTSEGPAPLGIRRPRIEPEDAQADFSFTAYATATQQGEEDTVIDSWPRGFQAGRSMRLDVSFDPHAGAVDTANGELRIPYEAGVEIGTIVIPLLSGDPKSRIVLGPATGSVGVTGDVAAGDAGTRTAVIYNQGNGDLDVMSVEVKANFDLEPEIFSLGLGFTAETVAPNELLQVPVDYDLAGLADPADSEQEFLEITYFNDFTQQAETITLGLLAAGVEGAELPMADAGEPADYGGAVVGEPLELDGTGSTGGDGVIVEGQGHVWYLTEKPAGSAATLNVSGGPIASFIPDVAGAYTVTLFVFAQVSGGGYLYSAPATVTVDVAQ